MGIDTAVKCSKWDIFGRTQQAPEERDRHRTDWLDERRVHNPVIVKVSPVSTCRCSFMVHCVRQCAEKNRALCLGV